jgi:hypothetical protein
VPGMTTKTVSKLVSIVIAFEGSGLRHADIIGLIGTQFGQFYAYFGQMQPRNFFV